MVRRLALLVAMLTACVPAAFAASGAPGASHAKLDRALQQRAGAPRGHSRVILRVVPGTSAELAIRGLRGTLGRRLASIAGQVVDVPDTALDALSKIPGVSGVSLDRRVQGTMERTGAT